MTQTAPFVVINAPAPFTFNYQNDATAGFGTEIIGAGTSGTLNVDVGAITGATATTAFFSLDYSSVNLNVSAADPALFGIFVVESAPLQAAPGLTVNLLGNAVTLADIAPVTPATVGIDTLTIVGGTILLPTDGALGVTGNPTGSLTIGVTNALVINDTSSGALTMTGPEDTFHYAGSIIGDNVFAAGAGSTLQGSLGTLTQILVNGYTVADIGWTGATSGTNNPSTNDILNDSAGGSKFYGDGGGDTITQGGGGNTDFFGTFLTGATLHNQIVTDNTDAAYTGFWDQGTVGTVATPTLVSTLGSTSFDMTTITGFQVITVGAVAHDVLDFNTNAWAGATYGPGALVNDAAAVAPTGNATMSLVITSPLQVIPAATDVVLDGYAGGYASASQLALALVGSAPLTFTTNLATNTHMLIAYADGTAINIADVDFLNGTAGDSTLGRTIVASDMVQLAGDNSTGAGLALLGTSPADIHFSHTVA